ncbi:MAG: AraC family transcriptional regulator [Clostridiaceae bacterium]
MQENIKTDGAHVQYRILGNHSSKERIGAGCMEKGCGVDFKDTFPADFSIVYVLSGKGTYTDYNGRSYNIIPGSFFMRFPDYKHTTVIEGADWHELFLAFGPQQGRAFVDMGFIDPEQPVGYIGAQPAIAGQVHNLCMRLQKAEQSELPYIFKSMSSLFFDMLEMNNLGKKKCENVLLMEKISEYIASCLQEKITINQLSHKFGISSSKLRKDFKQINGITIGRYLIRKRIEVSFKYLGDADLSIGQISEKLGYKNIHDFSNQFRKLTGHPPSYYRK